MTGRGCARFGGQSTHRAGRRFGSHGARLVGTLWLALSLPVSALSAEADTRRSGLQDMGPALQALQLDDHQNPAMLQVADAPAIWSRMAGSTHKACADCHGPMRPAPAGLPIAMLPPLPLADVAARYPTIDPASGQALNLSARVQQCRVRHQRAPAWPDEGHALLSITAWLGLAARGLPIQPSQDPGLRTLQREGQMIWQQRLGALNLACSHCHDWHAGQRLGGALIPQGHPTGYPIYRLQWQGMGSLQRRLRACLTGVRAEPYAPGAREWVALEAWLMKRAAGLPIETPAVRP